MAENITFRTHLLGSVTDFATSCDMKPFVEAQLLVELVVNLARYREEGKKLSPQIYLCESLDEILKRLPDSDFVKIGECPISEEAVGEILKKCAPLAVGGWCVFVEGSGDHLNFGLFRSSLNVLEIPIDRTLFSGDPGDMKVVRLHQTADDCIELMNHCGDRHNIFLSHRKEDSPHPKKDMSSLVKAICDQVSNELKETTETFIHKALNESLKQSHGSLIAVCRTTKLPKSFSDAVPFSPPIDFAEEIKKCKENSESANTSVLTSHASLLKGTLSCDGIVVFSRDAKFLAYRCFITVLPKEAATGEGGARRRAFNALCKKINRGVYAAFIQSQDGYTDFRRVENDQQ